MTSTIHTVLFLPSILMKSLNVPTGVDPLKDLPKDIAALPKMDMNAVKKLVEDDDTAALEGAKL